MMYVWIIGIAIIVMYSWAALSAMLEAYLDVKNRPKEEMFHCHVHGPFRKSLALPLFPELGGKAENSFVCPMCYKKTVWEDVDKQLR